MDTDRTTQISTDKTSCENVLCKDLTYKIIGALYDVHNALSPAHKENVYQKAVAIELKKRGLKFEQEKALPVKYKDQVIGSYK